MYARALFQAAQEKGRLDAVRAELEQVVGALDEVAELDALLADRDADLTIKAGVVREVFEGADPLVRNLLLLLIEKGRAGEVREVAGEFEALVAVEERILDVELTTAHELTNAEFNRIVAEIEKKSGRKVQATRSVEPELIGGIVLQAGSMRLDASVRGRLDRLRQELVTT
ncbi:MAG TPA: ATP synthase F1 subunit delta [Gaiellaceae bacterium]|nr:ATP synthase F1 subunit delta [Gaiellaceae bacterium]